VLEAVTQLQEPSKARYPKPRGEIMSNSELENNKNAAKKMWGSWIFLTIGIISLIAGLSSIAEGRSAEQGNLTVGIVLLLMTIAYRSAKKRYLNPHKKSSLSYAVEGFLVLATLLYVFGAQNIKILIATDPIPNFIIPVTALISYLFIFIKSLRKQIQD
jgi:Mn2+/Fe2+ NRAMP family transporter